MADSAYVLAGNELRENPGQWEAYNSEGNCVILAGPGSGKTKTITTKIARLIEEEVRPPRRLACITYSNECVGELRRRLRSLEVDDPKRIIVSTVHSFALTELVMPYGQLGELAIPDPLEVATPKNAADLFGRAYRDVTGVSPSSKQRKTCEILRRQNPSKTTDAWGRAAAHYTDSVLRFEELLLEEGLIDFDGIILSASILARKLPWVRKCLRAKYPILVIDEYQDLGVCLHEMVVDLLEGGVRVIAVGDPDQSIYGFSGAMPKLLRRLSERKDVKSVRLKLNYRCANEIVQASEYLLPDDPETTAENDRKGTILIESVGGPVAKQATYAFNDIVPKLLKQNPKWRYGDIAVLYRTGAQGTSVAQAAEALKIPYYRSDSGALVKRTPVNVWLTECAKWCSDGWQSGSVSLRELLRKWRGFRRSMREGTDLLKARAKVVKFLYDNRDGKKSLLQWLKSFQSVVLDEEFFSEVGLAEEAETFSDLLKLAEQGKPLGAMTVELFGNHGRSAEQVNLITLHGSKGLEFEAVIMPGLEEGEIPWENASDEDVEESGRLFYVGLTRAKTFVALLFDGNESRFVTRVRESICEED